MTDFRNVFTDSISYRCCYFCCRCYFAEPSTEIIGAPDLYIESGSTINLTCVVNNSPEPPAFIFWNHNNAVSIALYEFFISFYLLQLCAKCEFEKFKEHERTKRHIKDHGSMQWRISHHHNTHFISFMSHWKHLLKMDFHPWFSLVFFLLKLKFYDLHVHCIRCWSDSSRRKKRENKNQKTSFFNEMRWTGKKWEDMPCAFNMQTFFLVETFFSFSWFAWDMRNLHDPLFAFFFTPSPKTPPKKLNRVTSPTRASEINCYWKLFFSSSPFISHAWAKNCFKDHKLRLASRRRFCYNRERWNINIVLAHTKCKTVWLRTVSGEFLCLWCVLQPESWDEF